MKSMDQFKKLNYIRSMEKEKTYKPVKEYAQQKGISVQAVYKKIRLQKLFSKKIGSYTLVSD